MLTVHRARKLENEAVVGPVMVSGPTKTAMGGMTMTKAEMLKVAEKAGIELDDNLSTAEMREALFAGLAGRKPETNIDALMKRIVELEEKVSNKNPVVESAIDRARRLEEEEAARLNEKYKGRIFAGCCVTGLKRKRWYRGKQLFLPNSVTFFWIGCETKAHGYLMTGREIEQILADDTHVLCAEVKSKELPAEEVFALLQKQAPEALQKLWQQTRLAEAPKTLKTISEELKAPPGGVKVESETTKITTEHVTGLKGKEF